MMSGPIDTKSCSSNSSADLSDNEFRPLLKRIEPERFSEFALSVRGACRPSEDENVTCKVLPPVHGSYNLVYRLDFSDGVSWAMRIPMSNKEGDYEGPITRFMESELTTIGLLRRFTTIPIPEIISWDTTKKEVGVPYVLMEWVPGIPVSKLWFMENGQTRLEERRLRILDNIAACMSQLSAFSFDTIGSLSSSCTPLSQRYVASLPFNVVDEQAELNAITNKTEREFVFTRIGPFNSSKKYLKSLFSMQDTPDLEEDPLCSIAFGRHQLLMMMIDSLPPSVESGGSGEETFVLAPPDFNYQNILAKEDGTITAFIDWDNVRTLPHHIGYASYPSWLTRDWDPARYAFGSPVAHLPENSPEELDYYRQHYANAMRALRPDGKTDFTTKSHLHEAVWIAASSPISQPRIVQKIFEYVFPRDPEGVDEDSLDFLDVVYSIADEELDPSTEKRIYESFRQAFSVASK
jgi:Phosphotransferase enzyme family